MTALIVALVVWLVASVPLSLLASHLLAGAGRTRDVAS